MSDRNRVRSLLRAVGSLWFAGVLLVLLMVAMGTATVHESVRGTELAKAAFYHARWFRVLLVLLGANVASAVALRYPFNRKLIPFLLAHTGILVTLGGALVTEMYGIDGQLGLAKGETGTEFLVPGERLTLKGADGATAEIDLAPVLGRRLSAVESPAVEELRVGAIRAQVIRYLPDIEWERRITDDGPRPLVGVEVALADKDGRDSDWLFPGSHGDIKGRHSDLVEVATLEQWDMILGKSGAPSKGQITVTVGGVTAQLAMESCEKDPVPVEGTKYTIRLTRYLPHAVVGPDRKSIVNASDRPVNPAIEVEVVGPEGTDSRIAFAKFPDFHGRMSDPVIAELKIAFAASPALTPSAPVELLSGPEGRLAVRFAREGADMQARELTVGEPVKTPWPGQTLTVLRRFANANITFEAVEQKPVRESRQPALLVKVADHEEAVDFWVQKSHERRFTSGNDNYVLTYGDYSLPLGFNVTLNQFRIGYYPGGERARSYESSIRLTDPATGHDQEVVVSMNRPVSYGGYTLYQSSYRKVGDDWATVLSVSRDYGRAVVFVGYTLLMVGMAWLLGRRLKPDKPKTPKEAPHEPTAPAAGEEVSA